MNPVAWVPRQIDAPAGELLSRSEVARLLFTSEDTIKRLIEDGEFPTPLAVRGHGNVWQWQDVLYYRMRMALASRLVPKGTAGKPDANGG